MKKYLYFLPAFIIMFLIFWASNDPASGEKSDFITKFIWQVITYISGIKPEYYQEISTSYLVRKIAHMTEYAVLNLAIYLGIYKSSTLKYSNNHIIIAGLLSLLYSITDEFHQSFVPGRVGTYKDVLIDLSGILISSLIIKNWLKGKLKNQY